MKLWEDYQTEMQQNPQGGIEAQQAQQAHALALEKVSAEKTSANAKMLHAKTEATALPAENQRAEIDQELEFEKLAESSRKTNLHAKSENDKLQHEIDKTILNETKGS